MTRTFAILDVSPECYAEVRALGAGHGHALDDDGNGAGAAREVVDLHGVALRSDPDGQPPPSERDARLDALFGEAFREAEHPALLDYVSLRFEVKELRRDRAALAALRDAVRAHRDARGDDRCWRDDEALYGALPEGYEPPARDAAVELELCREYIASRQHPATAYVSPQREIERLQAALGDTLSRLVALTAFAAAAVKGDATPPPAAPVVAVRDRRGAIHVTRPRCG